jgi:hypothetical protein
MTTGRSKTERKQSNGEGKILAKNQELGTVQHSVLWAEQSEEYRPAGSPRINWIPMGYSDLTGWFELRDIDSSVEYILSQNEEITLILENGEMLHVKSYRLTSNGRYNLLDTEFPNWGKSVI